VTLINSKIPLNQTGSFSKLFLDYLAKKESLGSFYHAFPDLAGFEEVLKNRRFDHRETLVNVLKKQYDGLPHPPNLESLKEKNTFCVTTGHQLNIFTGPLYVIFKIVSTINLAKKLKENFPAYNFVPVYWMATEDHDFEEIASFHLFGQTHHWHTQQKGAVGRMNPYEISEIFKHLKDKPDIFERAYSQQTTLAQAVRAYMHELFGEQGLVSVDGDDTKLKNLFSSVMQDDLSQHTAEKVVSQTSAKLETLGYKTQIHARNINLFYLEDGLRERIEKRGEAYGVVNTEKVFSATEIAALLNNHPEKFSPNVVMRPLYQETILPNLAYLGGPAEITYWLQLKDIFQHYELPFPVLMPRNFGLVLNQATLKRMQKLNVSAEELFVDDIQLKKSFVAKNSANELSLANEKNEIDVLFKKIIEKALAIDPTLVGVVEAEKTKQLHTVDNLEKRLKKAEEKNFETAIGQLLNLKEKLFPGGVLQERKENFLSFYLNDPTFISTLLNSFDPLDFRLNVIPV
jgi:bacillithiol synthase